MHYYNITSMIKTATIDCLLSPACFDARATLPGWRHRIFFLTCKLGNNGLHKCKQEILIDDYICVHWTASSMQLCGFEMLSLCYTYRMQNAVIFVTVNLKQIPGQRCALVRILYWPEILFRRKIKHLTFLKVVLYVYHFSDEIWS